MRQNGERGHTEALKFSARYGELTVVCAVDGRLQDDCEIVVRLRVNEMKGPSPPGSKSLNIGADEKIAGHRCFKHCSCVAAIFIGLAHAQDLAAPPAPAPSELQTQVEALLESGPFEIHGAHIAYPSVIYAFYAQRAFRPAWTNARTASELRRALKDSEADGLDPRDYHLAVLEQLAAARRIRRCRLRDPAHRCAVAPRRSPPVRKSGCRLVRRALELHAHSLSASTSRRESNAPWRATTSMPRSKS